MNTINGGRPWWVPAHAAGWTVAPSGTTVAPITGVAVESLTGVVTRGPSLMTMATNLAGTALSAVVFVSEETYNKRMSICEGCEFLDKSIYRCLKCGCMMKAKARVEVAKCPLQKW